MGVQAGVQIMKKEVFEDLSHTPMLLDLHSQR